MPTNRKRIQMLQLLSVYKFALLMVFEHIKWYSTVS